MEDEGVGEWKDCQCGLPTVCLKADDGSEVEQNIYLPLFRGKETEETSVDDDTVMWMGEGE